MADVLTLSERKRRKVNGDAQRYKAMVNIGTAIDQWTELRTSLSIDNDELAVTRME